MRCTGLWSRAPGARGSHRGQLRRYGHGRGGTVGQRRGRNSRPAGASGGRITGNVISAMCSAASPFRTRVRPVRHPRQLHWHQPGRTAKLPNVDGVSVSSTRPVIRLAARWSRNVISFPATIDSASLWRVPSATPRCAIAFKATTLAPITRGCGLWQFHGRSRSGFDHSADIGGTDPGAGNVISGNGPYGIWLYGGNGNKNTRIQGNLIGTTADQSGELPNWRGIEINGAVRNFTDNVLIGGAEAGAGNVISGNSILGIQILGAAAAEFAFKATRSAPIATVPPRFPMHSMECWSKTPAAYSLACRRRWDRGRQRRQHHRLQCQRRHLRHRRRSAGQLDPRQRDLLQRRPGDRLGG